jgi:hypothetical protein
MSIHKNLIHTKIQDLADLTQYLREKGERSN